MKENEASFTAMMTAYMRAYHAMHDTPKIFDDSLAYHLIPEEKLALIEQYLTWDKQLTDPESAACSDQSNTFEPLIQTPNALSRARYTEDALEEAVSQGVKQYIILGAGLDTFAFRRPEMMELLEVFEVDHPATQEFKLHRLAELGWEHPAKFHYIPVDFTKENLVAALTRSPSYDPMAKGFFSWLGVTYYLTRDDVFATLRSIKDIAPEGSMVIFDYSDADAFIPEKSSPQMQKKLEFFRKIGEPMITGFNPSTLAEDIASLGFRLNENLSLVDIKGRYFQGLTDGYFAQEYEYVARAVVERTTA
jgi:methyltransferase (TIGR00027 family)